jgi:predicted phosphodiesterase
VRYGVFADVHGNLPALEAVLAALERAGVDAYVSAGDLVGYGPFPNECVERVAALDPVCVAGNHDLIVLGRLTGERCIPLAQATLEWTRRVLSDGARAYLAALPLQARAGAGIVVAHGSLDDPEAYTRDADAAARERDRLTRRFPDARVLVLGHTHRAAAWSSQGGQLDPRDGTVLRVADGETHLVNPGAVGQSRERTVGARFAILDADRGELTFHRVSYDSARCRRALHRHGLPLDSYHLDRSRRGALERGLRRLVPRSSRIRGGR